MKPTHTQERFDKTGNRGAIERQADEMVERLIDSGTSRKQADEAVRDALSRNSNNKA